MTVPTIAFNTANLVAFYTGFRFKLADWGRQHELTAATIDFAAWQQIAATIRAAGYDAIEVWVALLEKLTVDPASAQKLLGIWRSAGLRPVALAGPLNDNTAALCQRLGIDAVCGGYWGSDKATAARVMRETGIRFNYENHAEKSVDEIRSQVDLGRNGFAIALDTGWLGTQGIDAPIAVRELGSLIRHVHLKDVNVVGGHDTVPLGTGCVDIPGVVRELKAIGYRGILSWEDEPEARNPFDIAGAMREYILDLWSRT